MVTNAGQTQPFLKEFLGLIAFSPVLVPFMFDIPLIRYCYR